LFAVCALFLLVSPAAQAGVARAVELGELVRASETVVVGTAVESLSQWETLGKQRRIVTYSRIRVDQQVAGAPVSGELWVRTLGGRVGKIGQIVHGEARLFARRPALLFLELHAPGVHRVVALAQGHFPLKADATGELRLGLSPELSVLYGADRSAARLLNGRTLSEAQALIKAAAAER
jgi:hypothetical protein